MKLTALMAILATLVIGFNNCGKNVPVTPITSDSEVQTESLGSLSLVSYVSTGAFSDNGDAGPNLSLEMAPKGSTNAQIITHSSENVGIIKRCTKSALLDAELMASMVQMIEGMSYTRSTDDKLNQVPAVGAGYIRLIQDDEKFMTYQLEDISEISGNFYFTDEDEIAEINKAYSEVFQQIKADPGVEEKCQEGLLE